MTIDTKRCRSYKQYQPCVRIALFGEQAGKFRTQELGLIVKRRAEPFHGTIYAAVGAVGGIRGFVMRPADYSASETPV